MKTMTCRQLGGACDQEFQAQTFEEMGELSKAHAMEMAQREDADHLAAMAAMKETMGQPGAFEKWFAETRKQFEALPES